MDHYHVCQIGCRCLIEDGFLLWKMLELSQMVKTLSSSDFEDLEWVETLQSPNFESEDESTLSLVLETVAASPVMKKMPPDALQSPNFESEDESTLSLVLETVAASPMMKKMSPDTLSFLRWFGNCRRQMVTMKISDIVLDRSGLEMRLALYKPLRQESG
ncbi:hypothetical protein ACLOJK_014063 [Asimina triloba]